MIAVDTNVLLRRLLNDDAMQAEKARRLFETQESVLVTDVVLAETIWTLTGKRYGASKDELAAVVMGLLEEHNVVFESREAVWSALNDSLAVRRLRILDFDFHRVTTKAHSIRGDVFRGGVHSDAASFDIEVRRVPRTLDFLADDLPFGEWAAFVRTVVINRVDLAIEVYECEALAFDLHTDHAGFGNLRLLGDFDELAHCSDITTVSNRRHRAAS